MALCACLLAGVAALPATAPAASQVRATLTWDTDDTDIDLHVWTPTGEHAWWKDKAGIPSARLSTDIRSGFGPERMTDTAEGTARTFTYGLCYYESNVEDGSVPETVATVEITEPDGTVRTIRKRLRREGDAFLLGASPAAAANAYVPGDPSWCRGATSVHPPGDDGGVGQEGDGGGSPSAPFEGCTRTRRRIGVVEVCADTITGEGPQYRLSGDVRMNGAVAVGGPVTIDTTTEHIVSDGLVGIAVRRAGGLVPVAAGVLDIDANATSDASSGRGLLALMRLSEARLEPLRLGGLQATAPDAGSQLSLFVDERDGGGIIVPARLALPFGGAGSEPVSLGVHATADRSVRLLADGVGVAPITLRGGWRIEGLRLAYAPATDSWTVAGGIVTNALRLGLTGPLTPGRTDALGVTTAGPVRIRQTGFVLSSVQGSLQGLLQQSPKLALTAAGRWGAPGVLSFRGARLDIGVTGDAGFSGPVVFGRGEGGSVSGDLSLARALDPRAATGRLDAAIALPGIALRGRTAVTMSRDRLTATGGVSGWVRGLRSAGGRAVLSERGVAGFADVCIRPGRRCKARTAIGFALDWKKAGSPQWVGAAAGGSTTARHALLVADATTRRGAARPRLRLRAPSGRVYDTASPRPDMTIVRDAARRYLGVTVLSPERGRWRVVGAGSGSARVRLQAVPRMERIRAGLLRPGSTQRRPLRRTRGAVALGWSSRGLPAGTTVDVYASSDAQALGRRVARNLRPRGGVRISMRSLRAGRNHFTLVVRRGAIVLDQVQARQSAWVR